MNRLSTVMLLLAILPQQCNFKGDAVRQAETQIRPYFPKTQATLTGGGRTLRAITCVDLGPKAIESLPSTLDDKVKDLKSPLTRAMTGIHAFELGFEDSLLRLDLKTGKYSVVPAPAAPGYAAQYKTSCTGILHVPAEAQIFVGRFKVSVQAANNSQIQVIETYDTLGIYRPQEFDSARDAEVEARRQVMGVELRKRGLNVVGIELAGIGRIPAPDAQAWTFAPASELESGPPVHE